jgi:hypothetical protein
MPHASDPPRQKSDGRKEMKTWDEKQLRECLESVADERLGHATVSITLDTCSRAIPATQEEADTLIAGLVLMAKQESRDSRYSRLSHQLKTTSRNSCGFSYAGM